MSGQEHFEPSRNPIREVTLAYDGPDTIFYPLAVQLSIQSDHKFWGQPGCSETCKLVSVCEMPQSIEELLDTVGDEDTRSFEELIDAQPLEEHINKVGFIRGKHEGAFDPAGGDQSRWAFQLAFNAGKVMKDLEKDAALMIGSRDAAKKVTLMFIHEWTEIVPEAVPHDRELTVSQNESPKTLTYKNSKVLQVDLTLMYRLPPSYGLKNWPW